MTRMLISATRKSSGKTAFSMGLAAVLSDRGFGVQTFKKGPDYIDPMWLAKASGRPCINLDFHTQARTELEHSFRCYGHGADVVIVEGNKGLHDGMDVDGTDCNAALAGLLDLPVILLVDASGITRGIAPLVHGYLTFDPQVDIAGVVLNKVSGARHEQKLRAALAHYCDVPVLGAIPRCADMFIEERHIGLIPTREDRDARSRIGKIAALVAASVDVEAVLRVTATETRVPPASVAAGPRAGNDLRIGVARDPAFGFYYPDDLDAMSRSGAKVEFFDTLRDESLPDVDALFIGGGFPELYLHELGRNARMRKAIKRFVDDGRPVYAECGGLMYLCRDIRFEGTVATMVGALAASAIMQPRPVGRGYVLLEETADHPWPAAGTCAGAPIPVHEFHYSRLENLGDGLRFAFKVARGVGIRDGADGLVHRNLLATYSHHRNVDGNRWVERFVDHIRGLPGGESTVARGACRDGVVTLIVTQTAAQRILTSSQEGDAGNQHLRVAARRRPDGGIEYAMGFDDPQNDDVHVHWHGLNVIVAPTSTELLTGTTLDFVELEAGAFEFIFMNPNDPHYVPPKS